MWEIVLQLHGGHSSGGGSSVKQSAPGSSAVATVDNATESERANLRDRLAKAKGRRYTNQTGGVVGVADQIKKALLGE
ncbi:MAG: hypothetical protein IKZ43_07370 [Acidaminococcaceae bacterium]|nr:hypothetical protein [Acidaminococcaceae bacterium]